MSDIEILYTIIQENESKLIHLKEEKECFQNGKNCVIALEVILNFICYEYVFCMVLTVNFELLKEVDLMKESHWKEILLK